MKLFDIFDESGEKLGEIHEPSSEGGCFGFFVGFIFLFFIFGGGFFSWYVFINDGFYKEFLLEVIITMLIVGLSSSLCVVRIRKILRSILLSILIGGITFSLFAILNAESFFAGLLLGLWISMLPASIFVIVFKLLIFCFKQKK